MTVAGTWGAVLYLMAWVAFGVVCLLISLI